MIENQTLQTDFALSMTFLGLKTGCCLHWTICENRIGVIQILADARGGGGGPNQSVSLVSGGGSKIGKNSVSWFLNYNLLSVLDKNSRFCLELKTNKDNKPQLWEKNKEETKSCNKETKWSEGKIEWFSLVVYTSFKKEKKLWLCFDIFIHSHFVVDFVKIKWRKIDWASILEKN